MAKISDTKPAFAAEGAFTASAGIYGLRGGLGAGCGARRCGGALLRSVIPSRAGILSCGMFLPCGMMPSGGRILARGRILVGSMSPSRGVICIPITRMANVSRKAKITCTAKIAHTPRIIPGPDVTPPAARRARPALRRATTRAGMLPPSRSVVQEGGRHA